MEENPIARLRPERALLLLLPLAILVVLWTSTKGAPGRFHLITFSSYGMVTLVGITLSLINKRFFRPSVVMHIVWLLIYVTTAIFQQIGFNSVSAYSGDSRLSGLLWIASYLGYALVAPIAATVVWITTGRRARECEGTTNTRIQAAQV